MFVIEPEVTLAHANIRQSLQGDNLSSTEIRQVVPPGWHTIVDYMFAVKEIIPCKFESLLYDKGLLRVTGTADGSSIHQKILYTVLQSCAKDSAYLCIACGKKGRRRKEEPLWPCLCKAHYIQYINVDG